MKFAALFAAMIGLVLVGCKPDNPDPAQTLEALIKSIKIANGGISGGDMINGEVDQTTKTIVFNDVPAETNIAAVKFQATVSLGAALENDVIDFTQGNDPTATTLTCTLKCINKTDKVSKEETYQVTLNLKNPEKAPVIEKIVVKDDKGTESTLTSTNIMDGLLCLGIPESNSATIVEVILSPARATYEFTTAADGVIQASNPGYFSMEFMGLKSDVYEVTFASSPTPGADWSQAVVHDFSLNTGNRYVDLAEEYTRGGDFDGQYVLLANRTAPKLLLASDLLNDNTSSPILLNTNGIEGGTYVISAGRLSHGHIYLCNLTTKIDDTDTTTAGPLKVYHYDSPTATPELILRWDGSSISNSENDFTGRLGDNISVDLDENGNGYIFFNKQIEGSKMYRFAVSGWTQFSDPVELSLPTDVNYYGMFNRVGDNQYLLKSSPSAMMWLMNADATILREFEWQTTPNEISVNYACDPRMFVFNRSRYLILSNSRRFLWYADEGAYVFDISEGNDMVAAMVKLQERQDEETLEPCYYYVMSGNESNTSACVALCNAAEVDGKLLIWAAAPHVGMCLIEVPKMK